MRDNFAYFLYYFDRAGSVESSLAFVRGWGGAQARDRSRSHADSTIKHLSDTRKRDDLSKDMV